MWPVSGGALPTVAADLQDIMFLLSTQDDLEDCNVLTDEQKEHLGDPIDSLGARSNAAEGLEPGNEQAFEPAPRWWRDQGMGQGLAL